MTASDALASAALAYASRGWPVFPCNPEHKRPLTEHGVKDASTDPEMICRWWKQWPKAMIGLACGRAAGMFVVDFDVEDDPSGEKLAGLFRALVTELELGELPPTWEVITPRGGRHLYYAWPAVGEPVGNRGGLLGKGSHIDVRGEHGYAILPPSARSDGKRYEWVHGRESAGKDAQPAAAPAKLLDCIRRSGKWAPAPASDNTGRARQRPPLRLVDAPGGPPGAMAAGDDAVQRYTEAALTASWPKCAALAAGTATIA
jgi:putative DNA primase/helicase